jgi:hypothetical protein
LLEVAVVEGGGVRISGTEHDLMTLVDWIELALTAGRVSPAFAADLGLTTVEIVCEKQ